MMKMAWRTRIILLLAILLLVATTIVIARRSAPSGPVFQQPLTVTEVMVAGDAGTMSITFTDATGTTFFYSTKPRLPYGQTVFSRLIFYRGWPRGSDAMRLSHLGPEHLAVYAALAQWRRDHPDPDPAEYLRAARGDPDELHQLSTIRWANIFIDTIEQDMWRLPDLE